MGIHALIAMWLVVVGGGTVALWNYKTTPGALDRPPATWPADSTLERAAGPRLLVFIHPECTCTRATLSELAALVARVGAKVTTTVVVDSSSRGDARDRANEDLARAIPTVDVVFDERADEKTRFAVRTSGEAVLYDARGHLAFFGGITVARGHAGDNDGRDRLEAAIRSSSRSSVSTHVYGCELADSTTDRRASRARDGEPENR